MNFFGTHAGEIIIALVKLPDMFQAQPAPARWIVGTDAAAAFRRGAEFTLCFATGNGARRLPPFYPTVEAIVPPPCS